MELAKLRCYLDIFRKLNWKIICRTLNIKLIVGEQYHAEQFFKGMSIRHFPISNLLNLFACF